MTPDQIIALDRARRYQGDIIRFTSGDCHFLAAAISKRTGWPMYTFFEPKRDKCGYWEFYSLDHRETSKHAFVLMPRGEILDVEGAHKVEDFFLRWKATEFIEVEWKEIRKTWGGSCFERSDRKAFKHANRVARELIVTHG